MACSACHHQFSFLEGLRIHNPLAFNCPTCGVSLTLDGLGWAFSGIAIAVAIWFGLFAADLYQTAAWTLLKSLLALLGFIVAVGAVEALYLRVARFPRR